MDDMKRDDQDNSPMPPSTRSERIGPAGDGSGKKKPMKKGLSRFFTKKWFFLVTFTSLLLLVGGCSAIILSAKTYKLDEINKIDFSTTIFGKDRKTVVGKVGSENRESLTYEQITKVNPDLPLAFVKVEDERFFKHHGVDYRGFARAFTENILALKYVQGASTITMQVVGNVVLKDRKQTIWRKLKEVVGAYNLEREASKEKILEVYMNYVDFGNSVHGVQMASKIYFGKDLTKDKLEPQEIALLAGLPKAPYGYNPYGAAEQQQKALDRRNVALLLMSKGDSSNPLITPDQKKALQKTSLGVNVKFKEKYLQKGANDAYKDFVQKELRERYGISYSELNSGGYKIYTAMDKKAQSSVESALKDDSLFQNKKRINAGVTMMNSRNGEVMAVGGGRTFTPGSYNWATMKKQPGSAIKPLTVYGPLVEFKDYNEYTMINDKSFTYRGWSPKNYSRRFYGEVPLKEVVAKSLNTSTAELLVKEVTVPRSYEFATRELELPLVPADEVPAALALGGLTEGVSTVNMAQAFTAFSNRGEMTKAHAVLEVVDSEGEIQRPLAGKEIDENGNAKRVWSEKTAWYMTRMLQGVVANGTGRGARLEGGRPVLAKTGTTQESLEGSITGGTPSVMCSVIVFNEPGSRDPIAGGGLPSRIFSRAMSGALRGTPVQYFTKPNGVEEPKKPFKLEEPSVSGKFDSSTSSIHLKWDKQDERVSFEVLRSQDGSSWTSLAEQPAGSTGYTDTNIGIEGFPLPDGAKKAYYYQVIAIDTAAGERKTSKPIKVIVTPPAQNPPADGDTGVNPGGPGILPRPNPGHDNQGEKVIQH